MPTKLIQKRPISRVRLRHVVIILLASIVTALSCGWSYVTDHSVRFNSYRTGRGFYTLRPLPIAYDSEKKKDLTVNDLSCCDDFTDQDDTSTTDQKLAESNQTWDDARAAIDDTKLDKAAELLKKFLAQTIYRSAGYDTADAETTRLQRRSTAYDILDAMMAQRQGSKENSVKDYLLARYAYDAQSETEFNEKLEKGSHDANLEDNWEYLKAARLFSTGSEAETALSAFRVHIQRFPNSEKNEAAMFMYARSLLQSSYSFEKDGCGLIVKDSDSSKVEPEEKCRDIDWHEAVGAIKRVMEKYPRGRYFNDARGWLAFLYKRGGERAKALAEYYKMLGDVSDRPARLEAKHSLEIVGDDYDDDTLNAVENLIQSDLNASMAYAYYRIYNYAVDSTYQKPEIWYSQDWKEQADERKRVLDAHNAGEHELERIVRFADAMMKRYPQAPVTGGFVVRVAEAQIELKNYRDSLTSSKKALTLGVKGDLRAQALWIKGSSEHAQKEFTSATKTFKQLIAEFPDSNLIEGARRLLALTAEDQNDLDAALEQYLALHYHYDISYYIDILMPTDRLAAFVKKHRQIPEYNDLLYALGIRYMRDQRWDEAGVSLSMVRSSGVPSLNEAEGSSDSGYTKYPNWNWGETHYIKSSWVMTDLKTIDDLKRLQLAIQNADGDEAKAEAMYQFASYQFDADELLFYNPLAWDGERYELLSQLSTSDSMRLPNESQTILDYSRSHETLARAIPIFLGIADRYPKTRAAPDALYSAAVAEERLSDYNPYWRDVYSKGLVPNNMTISYADVKRRYPRYRFPIGTRGWEASTRTVNGGEAWPAPPPPPKPKTRITREERVKRKLKEYFNEYSPIVKSKVASSAATSYQWLCTYLYVVFGSLVLVLAWRMWKSRM
jgi:TolA-binding protein